MFAILALPLLFFAIRIGISDHLTFGKVIAAIIEFMVVGFAAWLLKYGLSKGSIILVTLALLMVIMILIAYAAAISLLVGGLKIKIF